MLKMAKSLNELEHRAAEALKALLDQVPAISSTDVELEARGMDWHADILARVNAGDRRHVLVCEVKASGQPRHVRMAVLQLRNYAAHYGADAVRSSLPPTCRPRRNRCAGQRGWAFLISKETPGWSSMGYLSSASFKANPLPIAVNSGRSSSRNPRRSCGLCCAIHSDPGALQNLATAADVSLGHISNVRLALLDREWAAIGPDGLFLIEPDRLLDAWRDAYEPPAGKRLAFYTTLHGSAFEQPRAPRSPPRMNAAAPCSPPSRQRTGWRPMRAPEASTFMPTKPARPPCNRD